MTTAAAAAPAATSETIDALYPTPGIAVSTVFGASTFIVWQKDGLVYAVGGTYPRERVLAIANSLR